MKDSNEQRIQNQFGAFCTTVLKNEARCIQRECARRREQEKPLDELTASELEQTATWDKYFMDEHVFEVQGLPVVVTGNLLAEAHGAVAGGQTGRDPTVLLPGYDVIARFSEQAECRPSDHIQTAACHAERIARVSDEGGI